jgi:two-component system, LytTR family, response regulator
MIINCIVIEDEPLAQKKLNGYIKQVDFLNLLFSFNEGISALNFLKTNPVDLIFLDIRMKNFTGLELLRSLKIKPKIIITSAYDEYALQGYEFDVTDYLLKPFSFDRFFKAVDKVYGELLVKNIGVDKETNTFIFVKTEYRMEKIFLDEILFIQGMKDYLRIITSKKKIMTLQTFKNVKEMLPEKDFARVHNSYMVSINKIESIERNRIKIGETLIPITDNYKDSFYELLKKKKHLL